MLANEVAITRLPSPWGESWGCVCLTTCSQSLQPFNARQWCKVCLRSQPNWECMWNKMCQVYRNDRSKLWHSGSVVCLPVCLQPGLGGPVCAFPHTCVDTEALAAPDPRRPSFTHSFTVLSAMASHTASAFSLAHTVDLAVLSLEFNRNLSCCISHFRMLHRL